MTTRLAPSPYRCACCGKEVDIASDHPRAATLRRNNICPTCDARLQARIEAAHPDEVTFYDATLAGELDLLPIEIPHRAPAGGVRAHNSKEGVA